MRQSLQKSLLPLLLVFLTPIASAPQSSFQTGHTHDILEVKFSPDDTQLISYSAGDGRYCLWDVKTGRLLWMTGTGFIQKGDEYYNLKEFYWSMNGKVLVTRSMNGTFQLWDATTGKILELTETKPGVATIVPTRKEVSVAKNYGQISITNGQTKQTREIKRFGNQSAFDISNDGTMIAEGGSWGDASIRITNIDTGKSWWLDGHPSVVGALTFSPDGKLLAVGGSDKNIYIFETAAGPRLLTMLVGHTKPVKSISFSSDGQRLFSIAKMEALKIWDLKSGKVLNEIEPEFWLGFSAIKFSSDGKYFLTANDWSGFDLWETDSLKSIRKFCMDEHDGYECGSKAMSLSFSQDGKRIFAGYENGTIKIWDLKQVVPLKIIQSGDQSVFVAIAMERDQILAASYAKDVSAKLLDTKSGKVLIAFDQEATNYVEALAVSNDGKHFATADISGDVLLWSLTQEEPIRKFDIGFSGDDAIVFSPDGKTIAAGGRNQNVFLFDVETGNKLWQLIPSYQPSELEVRLTGEKDRRQAILSKAKWNRDRQAAIDTEVFQKQIHITFEHYGDMTHPGDLRMMESSEPTKSKVKKSAEDGNAIWLRLHNDSPLPIQIPTQSMYLPDPKCFHQFSTSSKLLGLCDSREVAMWFGLEDKNGKQIPFGFDFGSASILLPKTSVLFAVPREVLKDGKAIRFAFTFQKDDDRSGVDDYGTAKVLKFRESDLPKAH